MTRDTDIGKHRKSRITIPMSFGKDGKIYGVKTAADDACRHLDLLHTKTLLIPQLVQSEFGLAFKYEANLPLNHHVKALLGKKNVKWDTTKIL